MDMVGVLRAIAHRGHNLGTSRTEEKQAVDNLGRRRSGQKYSVEGQRRRA